ncbi:MAG TPA: SAM-dependent methyltransferase [Bacillota bacterium]|nr:SAM-dependent methyltransferase [Bacillota bacterium]
MLERKYDQALRIRTSGVKELQEKHHNRVESTPYEALDVLTRKYTFHKDDQVVDFGCGRGRALFYIHHHFNVPITGIEADDETFDEILLNKKSYMYEREGATPPITLEYGLAEMYEIKKEDNKFYFFNPFELPIFRKVVYNILQSVNEHPRTVELILYYPLSEFKHFLQSRTPFELINQFDVPRIHGKYGKFAIYRYDGLRQSE